VLNLFSYTGAFSPGAPHAGAREVVSVDSVAKVHARARRNCELQRSGPGRIEESTTTRPRRWSGSPLSGRASTLCL
jgi:hypothetical protein